jgi:outer membrane protein assembly factor BamB
MWSKLSTVLIVVVSLLTACGDSDEPAAEQSRATAGTGETGETTSPPPTGDNSTGDASGDSASWDVNDKTRTSLPVGLRTEPVTTTLSEISIDDDTASRVQWFDDTLVLQRTDGVTAFEADGTERWTWNAPIGVDDLERDAAVRFGNTIVLLSEGDFIEELVALDLTTGEETNYGATELGSILGATVTGVWGMNSSGDFQGVDLTGPVEDFVASSWHVDTNGPVGFSDSATVVAYDYEDTNGPDGSDAFINELRWYDLHTGALAHAPAPTVHQGDVDLGDNEVYALSGSDVGPSELVAYELKSGEIRWSVSVDGDADFGVITPVNEDLVALSLDPTVVFDAATGAEVWSENDELRADPDSAAFAEIAPGAIVAISDDNRLYARDVSTGELLWTTADRDAVRGVVLTTDTVVYVADARAATIAAHDLATGDRLWTVDLESDEITSMAVGDEILAATTPTALVLLHV